MVDSALKNMTKNSRLKVGTFLVEFNTPGIGQILKASGCDFVLVDMEHSGFSISDIKQILRYMQAADLPVIVRPPSKEYHHAARVLDIVAGAVMFPMVGSPEEVKRLLDFIKYPPKGGRGVALQIAHDRYVPGPVMKKLSDANRNTVFCALIETPEGVENADAIAAIKDVDLMWIGLSISAPIWESPGSSIIRNSRRRSSRSWRPVRNTINLSAAWCPKRRWAAPCSSRVSISSAIPAMSGCCKPPCRQAPTNYAPPARAGANGKGANHGG